MDGKTKVFPPYRCVAAFADGSRLIFDGLTRGQARSTMEAAMEQHGDIGWWDWVTDDNYRKGKGKWIPADQTQNLPRVHQKYKQKMTDL